MRRLLILLLCVVLAAAVVFVLWPVSAPAPLPLIPAGQEVRGQHLQLAALYEQYDLLDKAQSEYEAAIEPAATDEINSVAQAGLERVIVRSTWWEQQRFQIRTFLRDVFQLLFKTALVVVVALGVWWLIARVSYRSGYTLLPFDDLTGGNAGAALTQTFYMTIQRTRLLHQPAIDPKVAGVRNTGLPGLSGPAASEAIMLPGLDLSSSTDALGESLAVVDAIKWGGSNVPLGQLVAAARRWLGMRRYVITGNLIKTDQTLRLTMLLQDARTHSVVRLWEESLDASKTEGGSWWLAKMMAYQLIYGLSTSLQAPTWRSLAEFTEGLAQLRAYDEGAGERGLLESAQSYFENTVNLAAHYWPATFQLGLIYNRLGRYREAAEVFSMLQSSVPALHLEATYNLGVAYYLHFRDWAHERAERAFQLVVEQVPDGETSPARRQLRALAQCGLAAIYAARCAQHKAAAQEALSQVRHQVQSARSSFSSPLIEALCEAALGRAYFENRRYDEAIAAYQAALQFQPDDSATLVNLGMAYLATEQSQVAVAALQRAIRLNPAYEYAQYQLGRAWRAQDEIEEALAAFQHAPHVASAHNERGELLAAQQHYADALAAFRQALELSKKFAGAHANLAWWLLESGQTEAALDEAVEHARQAVALGRGSSREWLYHAGLGRVYLARRQHDLALKELLHSIELNDHAIQNRYLLAQVYQSIGKASAARAQLATALSLPEGGLWRERAEELMHQVG